uniref:RING-type domain-containing protein n=1 Tax=Eptatretus burgeri TaxID=7764 RepID=A0A8C4QT83_EPTBU
MHPLVRWGLRVPLVLILAVLSHWDAFVLARQFGQQEALWAVVFIAGHALVWMLFLLPLELLKSLYLDVLHIITIGLIFYFSLQSVELKAHEVHTDWNLTLFLLLPILLVQGLFIISPAAQLMPCYAFIGPVVPTLAKLIGCPVHLLPISKSLGLGITVSQVIYLLHIAIRRVKSELQHQLGRAFRVLHNQGGFALLTMVWNDLELANTFFLLLLTNFMLFPTQHQPSNTNWTAILINSLAQACDSLYAVLGLSCTMAHMKLTLIVFCRIILNGTKGPLDWEPENRTLDDALAFLLLAVLSGFISLEAAPRAVLIAISLIVYCTEALHSALKATQYSLLSLTIFSNKDIWQHAKAIILTVVLGLLPHMLMLGMVQPQHFTSWSLVLTIRAGAITLQAFSHIIIYILYMQEKATKSHAFDRMDDTIHYLQGACHGATLLSRLAVVLLGLTGWNSGYVPFFVIALLTFYTYLNVWLPAHRGWCSIRRRQHAEKLIRSMETLQGQQSQEICPICYQEIKSGVKTQCGHFYHIGCLQKWLGLQVVCPMCHQNLEQEACDR